MMDLVTVYTLSGKNQLSSTLCLMTILNICQILFHRLEMEILNQRLNQQFDSWMGPRGKLYPITDFISMYRLVCKQIGVGM